jgi:nucleoside-diphosphate-sugar epimerase
MNLFVAGASGIIGKALIPHLASKGHEVFGMTKSAERQELVRGFGARPHVAEA